MAGLTGGLMMELIWVAKLRCRFMGGVVGERGIISGI